MIKFVKGFFAVCFFILVFVGISQYIETSQPSNLAVSALCFFISILLFRSLSKKSQKRAKTTEESKQQNDKIVQNKPTIYTAFHHVNGLPLAENTICQISSYPDKIEFKAGTTEINLSRNKITDMCIKTDTEIQKQAVSSVGGAVAGAVMFGALGAVIGGRAKTKKIKNTTQYLIITYLNNQEEISYIGFDATKNILDANKLVNEFRKLNMTSGIRIDL